MKKLFIALLFSASALISCNSNNGSDKKDDDLNKADVPQVVQTAFNTKYPNATDIKWEKAKEDDKPTYKAKFKSEDKEVKAEFGEDGAFIKDKVQ